MENKLFTKLYFKLEPWSCASVQTVQSLCTSRWYKIDSGTWVGRQTALHVIYTRSGLVSLFITVCIPGHLQTS